jgi:hypothetical protein
MRSNELRKSVYLLLHIKDVIIPPHGYKPSAFFERIANRLAIAQGRGRAERHGSRKYKIASTLVVCISSIKQTSCGLQPSFLRF